MVKCMKERERNILFAILQNDGETTETLLNQFHISKRTLYYDIQDINDQIQTYGKIRNIGQTFFFFGDYDMIRSYLHENSSSDCYDPTIRQNYIVMCLFAGDEKAVDRLYSKRFFSKNTRINDAYRIQKFLESKHFRLTKKPLSVTGNEFEIRNLYLQLMEQYGYKGKTVSADVMDFNDAFHLQLTDYSLMSLSVFLGFIRYRIAKGLFISPDDMLNEMERPDVYAHLHVLLKSKNVHELNYLAFYISTLPSLNEDAKNDYVESYLDALIEQFEKRAALTIEDKEEFKKNIRHHMLSLYRRIRYHFPVETGQEPAGFSIEDESLHKVVKACVRDCEDRFPVFKTLPENEVCYIAAYFGGYLVNKSTTGFHRTRVLLVCPNGLTVSRILQYELYRYIPNIEVVGTISVSQLPTCQKEYDAIISTIPLPHYKRVLVVNPILTRMDIQKIVNAFNPSESCFRVRDLTTLLHIIDRNAEIKNKNRLIHELVSLFYSKRESERIKEYMLKDLITKERINVVKYVESWQKAIELASQPLIQDHSIEPSYITAMINNVEEHGPYIVLDDYFALPHAKVDVGVNKLGMSLLVVKDEVDLLRRPVNVFLILATVDSTSHLNALATLSEILNDRKNIEIFRSGDKKKILELINNY